jgi:hypothetical protein
MSSPNGPSVRRMGLGRYSNYSDALKGDHRRTGVIPARYRPGTPWHDCSPLGAGFSRAPRNAIRNRANIQTNVIVPTLGHPRRPSPAGRCAPGAILAYMSTPGRGLPGSCPACGHGQPGLSEDGTATPRPQQAAAQRRVADPRLDANPVNGDVPARHARSCRKVARAAGLAEGPPIVRVIASYPLYKQRQLIIRFCAAQQACISAPLQPLLQSATMSLMRPTAHGYNEPQVSNELEVCHERAGRLFRIRWIQSPASGRPRQQRQGPKKELGKWRSSKHATWSNGLEH